MPASVSPVGWSLPYVVASVALWAGALSTTSWGSEPITGHFLEHSESATIRMGLSADARNFGGFQTSDLTYDARRNCWWSIGDQNCCEAGRPKAESHRGRYVYRIDLDANFRPAATPILIWWDDSDFFAKWIRPSFETARPFRDRESAKAGDDHVDFEGFACHPAEENCFFACTEGHEPWLCELRLAGNRMHVVRSVRLSREGNHSLQGVNETEASAWSDWNVLINKRWEGLAVSPDGETLFLLTEWDECPSRLFTVSIDQLRNAQAADAPAKIKPDPFDGPALDGELTGVTVAEHGGKTYLVVLERNNRQRPTDPPSLHLIDLAAPQEVVKTIDLDLRGPGGVHLDWVSPEGIAFDGAKHFVLINDPVPKHYVATSPASSAVNDKLAALVPLVFVVPAASVFP